MASKVERKTATSAHGAPKPDAAAEELAILHPERELFIAGRRLIVREYGFVEGLKMRTTAQPFLDALYALAGSTGRPPSFIEVEALLAEHSGCVLSLIALAADVDPEWIAGLSDQDGYQLMQEWWIANSGFFIRRVVQRIATERAMAARNERPPGPTSTPPSSVPDMVERPQTSDDSLPGK